MSPPVEGLTPYEAMGGEWALRAVIHDFVEHVVDDAMIGFFFDGSDLHALKEREFEMTARFLGADIPYRGKGLRAAHMGRPIFGGQFDRRRQILLDAIRRHRVPEDVERIWMEHVDRLRSLILDAARAPRNLPIV